LKGWRAGGDVDRAGGGVFAVKRALGAAQNLHPVDVQEVERRRRDPAVIDLVDINADALFDAVVGKAERRAEAASIWSPLITEIAIGTSWTLSSRRRAVTTISPLSSAAASGAAASSLGTAGSGGCAQAAPEVSSNAVPASKWKRAIT
jgi:hypothetical protein